MKFICSILFFASALLCPADSVKWPWFDGDPVFEYASETNGASFLAVRPFYSHVEDSRTERWTSDYLWPLYTRKGFQDQEYSRFLFFGYSNDFSQTDERHRRWLLPIYFQGEDKNGEGYFALFPLGGTIHEFIGRDTISFALFPLYAQSQINEVKTTSVLWPIYSKTQGDRVDRFRVWPFYGRSELTDSFRKKFVLWPIYNSVEYLGDSNPGGGFILFPFYGHVETLKGDTQWWLPPFFRYSTSEEQSILHAPWPFVQLADGTVYKRDFWPIYGRKKVGALDRQYGLWPVFWNSQTEFEDHVQHRKSIVPLFTHTSNVATEQTEEQEAGEVLERYWKLWPLMSWERRGADSRFRTLELWPLRNTPGVERNWAPYWSLYRRLDVEGEVGHHLLWGLYRQRRGDEQFEWSLLKGLAGYKKDQNYRSYRILFMWFGGEEQP